MRWAVPVGAIAVVGALVGTGPVIAAVQGDPSLPERTAQELLAEAAKSGVRQHTPAMSGTVVETASLGLPALPITAGSSSSPMSLLSGSHTLKVWYGGDGKIRLALPGPMSETDLISDGSGQAWLWQSEANTATRLTLPKGAAGAPEAAHSALPTATTPDAMAAHVLKAAEKNTSVTVENGQHIAGRAAYQLVLTPKDSTSLIKEVKVGLDGETYIPLRVQVFAKGAAEPAFEVGFTQVAFSAPAPENFAFTPPAGAKIEEKTLGDERKTALPGPKAMEGDAQAHMKDAAGRVRTVGSGWGTIVEAPFSVADLPTPAAGERQGGDSTQLVTSLLKSAKQVSGPWGSGKVLESKLLSVLITDDGRLFAGAVTTEALTAAAGHK